jgi:hypothetical protein
MKVDFKNAYYIKLGKGADWANDCFKNGIIRIGWDYVPNIVDLNNRNWDSVRLLVKKYFDDNGKKNGATQDFNALKLFCEATEDDIFITFHKGKLYWCTPANSLIEKDNISKFRQTKISWSCNTFDEPSTIIHSNDISGEVSKMQAFQGTYCQFNTKQLEIIKRIINHIPNPLVADILEKREEICMQIEILIKDMYPKDCEILADLIFQRNGWQRVSELGGNMEFADMVYLDPITNDRYAVQVKSGANLLVLNNYEEALENREYRKLFFVVFNPEINLKNRPDKHEKTEILLGNKLAKMIFDLGLLKWLLAKSS